MQYLLLFHSNNGCTRTSQYYVILTLPVLYVTHFVSTDKAVLQLRHLNSFHFRNLLRICTQHPGHSYCASYPGVKFKRCYYRISDFTRDRSFGLTVDRKPTTIWRAVHSKDTIQPALLINTIRMAKLQPQSSILLSFTEQRTIINTRVQDTDKLKRQILSQSKFFSISVPLNVSMKFQHTVTECRFQWPRSLRRRSTDARLLRSWVRIPPRAWMFVCWVLCVVR